jgi:hypothetical protein
MRGRKEPRRDTDGLFAPQVRLKKWESNGEKKPLEVKNQAFIKKEKGQIELKLGIAADAGDELSCNWYWIPLIRTLIGSVLG